MTTPTVSSSPVSTPLWGQLLRKHTLAASATHIPLPPTAPLDRTGTSMRILLHDTQANFEKFSTKVDTLTSGIHEAKRELLVVKDLFQKEHDTLTMDFVDLVNRSQTQVQKSFGQPAQAASLESLQKNIDARFDGLTKRIDDMQLLHQNQSQTLQNVSQALLNLQDQQSKILSSLLPLLPLIQAVPVHINSARSGIIESMLKVSLESTRSHRTPPHLWPQPQVIRNKRSLQPGPPSSPLGSRKRPRLDSEHVSSDLVTPTRNHSRSFLLQSRQQTIPFTSRHKTLSSANPRRDPTVPRRPLGDLPLPPQNDESEKDVPHPGRKGSSSSLAHRTPLVSVPLLPSLVGPDVGKASDTAFPDADPKGTSLSERSAPPCPETPAPAPPSSPSPIPFGAPLHSIVATSDVQLKTTPINPILAPLTVRNVAVMQQQLAPIPVKAAMARSRRSPFRDGRRFIPLDDDDDSDSDAH